MNGEKLEKRNEISRRKRVKEKKRWKGKGKLLEEKITKEQKKGSITETEEESNRADVQQKNRSKKKEKR